MQGGNFGHGFWSAGIGASLGGSINGIKSAFGRIVASAVVGGTISKLTGGKFANGAFGAAFARTLGEARQGNLFAKEDSAGKTSTQKKVDIVKGNLADLDEAKQYVNETYDNLLDGIDIEFANLGERNIGEACITDSCIKLNFEKIYSGDRRYSTSEFVDTLVHEALHLRVNQELGTLNYMGGEIKSILGGAQRGAAHQWIYNQGNAAAQHYFSPRIYQRPDISMEALRKYMGGS